MHDLIIIGAGPAGLSAAVYASRAGAEVLILDSGAPGGKMNLTASIENYPGFKSIAGPDLSYQMFEQAMELGAKVEYGKVQELQDHGDHKTVVCDDKTYQAKAVLIASGTVERKMGLPREAELTGRGISYCAVCDGPFFKAKEVAVIGGGNSALEEADYLTKFVSKVHLIVRRDVFRADKIIQDKIAKNENIVIHFLKKPAAILEADNKVIGLELIDSNTGERTKLDIAGIFPFVGLDPVSDFATNLGILDEKGYVLTNEKMATKVAGIYAAGDVRVKELRQVVTAANDGAVAGQEIAQYLNK